MESLETFASVETPEQLELQLELAGIGSRFLAFVVDLLWQLVLILMVIALTVALLPPMHAFDDLELGNGKFRLPLLWIAIAQMAIFVVNFGYFVIFELLWRGQTPGKRSVGIRVVREGGFPLDATTSLLRNFLRSLDSLPAFYLIGVIAAFVSPLGQRIGDLVAKTLVVREPRKDGRLRLPTRRDNDAEIAADFLARRFSFAEPAGETLRATLLARELASAAAARRGLPPPEDAEAFLQSLVRAASLKSLEELIQSLERRQPSRDELVSFPSAYREAVARLAEARARGVPSEERAHLEALVLRAHGLLYAPAVTRLGTSIGDLLLALPGAVRAAWRPILLAAALTVLGTSWGYLEVRRDPGSAEVLLGALQENAERFQDEVELGTGHPLKGAFYFTHNSQVAFLCFALGASFGVGTVLLILINGILLGATAAVVVQVGAPRALVSWLLPHAAIELSAIFIAAAGGFQMAYAMLRPGWRTRTAALAEAARRALPLALGASVLLIVAGIAEGWIAPQPWPLRYKALIGLTLDALLLLYLFQTARGLKDSR